jgi:predicted dehydrogenase
MLRVGVIGLGAIGLEHALIYHALPEADLVAVADLDRGLATDIAQRVGARSYESAAQLLADPAVDAVSLCTPDQLHYEDAKRVLEAGKHLLLEKPIATTVAEADDLVAVAEATGLTVMPGHVLRFESKYATAKELVAQGKIGEIVHGYVRRNNKMSVAERVRGRTSVTFFLGVHDIDALMWITGLRIVEVHGMESRRRTPDGAQAAAVIASLRLDNGAVVQLDAAWQLPNEYPTEIDARLRLVGDSGELSIDIHDQGMHLFSGAHAYPVPAATPLYGAPQGALKEEIAAFIRAAESGGDAPVTMRQAADAVRVAVAVDEAIRADAPVKVVYP